MDADVLSLERWGLLSLGRPHGEDFDPLRGFVESVVDEVLRSDEEDATNTCELDVFHDRAGFRVFRDESKRSAKLVAKEVRRLRAVSPPPMRFVTNLPSGEGRARYTKSQSIRFVELVEQVVDVFELAAIRLGD